MTDDSRANRAGVSVARCCRRGLALFAIIAALLAACTMAPAGEGPASPTAGASASVSTTATPRQQPAPNVAASKKASGIKDCPASDPVVSVVKNGLPDVTLPCLGGGTAVRLAGLRGRPMMINIWAQWCAPCRQEAPFLSEVAAQADHHGKLMVLGINYSDPRPELAIEFAQLAGWTYPQLADPDLLVKSDLRVPGIPVTVFVNARGQVVYTHYRPFQSAAEIRDQLKEHLQVSW